VSQKTGESVLYWVVFAAGLLWTVCLLVRSDGVAVDDEVGHVLISMWAWKFPSGMLDIWGRPGNTVFYMVGALWGMKGARCCAVLASCLTVLVTTRVARKLGLKRLYLVPAFLWFQPWFNDVAYTAVTEVPFALLLMLGVYLWLEGKVCWASILIGLLPLVRYEGIALVGAWCLYLLLSKQFRGVFFAACPILVYNLAFLLCWGCLPFSIYLNPVPTTEYGSAGWTHYLPAIREGVGLPVLVLSLFSVAAMVKLKRKASAFALHALYLTLHVILYRFGLFAGGGLPIYLVPVAPAFCLAASLGAQCALDSLKGLFERLRLGEGALRICRFACITGCIVYVLLVGVRTEPRRLGSRGLACKRAAEWIVSNRLSINRVVSSHVWFYYFYGLSWTPEKGFAPPALDDLGSGAMVVWDNKYSERAGHTFEKLSGTGGGWRRLKTFGCRTVVLFQNENGSAAAFVGRGGAGR